MEDQTLRTQDEEFSLEICKRFENAKESKRKLLLCCEFTPEDYFPQLLFFPDEEIESYLAKFDLGKSYFRWFVPIQQIIDDFQNIESTGIQIKKLLALTNIADHLLLKSLNEICNHLLSLDKDNSLALQKPSKMFKNVIERRKRAKGNLKHIRQPTDYVLNEILHQLEQKSEDWEKFILKLSDGKTEYYPIRDLIEKSFFPPKNMSKRRFYITIYNLLRTIMKDEDSFVDERGFKNLDNDYDWDEYRAKQIKTIIYKK